MNAGGDNTWKSNSEASLIRVELSEKEWRQLNIDIRNLIENRISKTSQNNSYKYIIMTYSCE